MGTMSRRMDSDITELLMPGENVLLVASQSKVAPGGSISSPDRVYITTNRVLFKDPRMFGLRANITAVRYEEIATIMLRRGVFSTELVLKPHASLQHIDLSAIDKQVAVQVLTLIQRGMRGELIDKPPSLSNVDQEKNYPKPEEPKIDALSKIEKLTQMMHQGAITESEFRILKEELMLSIKPEIDNEEQSTSQKLKIRETKVDSLPQKPEVLNKPVETPKRNGVICRYCSFETVPALAKFCPDCGKDLKIDTNIWKMCPVCDAMTSNDAIYCSSCREKFPETLS
jgi:hypothetical protein